MGAGISHRRSGYTVLAPRNRRSSVLLIASGGHPVGRKAAGPPQTRLGADRRRLRSKMVADVRMDDRPEGRPLRAASRRRPRSRVTFDFMILLKTVGAVLRGSGAY